MVAEMGDDIRSRFGGKLGILHGILGMLPSLEKPVSLS